MGMLLPYWSTEQVLRESELVERDTSPRPLLAAWTREAASKTAR